MHMTRAHEYPVNLTGAGPNHELRPKEGSIPRYSGFNSLGGHRPGNRRSIDILRQPKSFGARPSSHLVKLLALLYHVSAQVSGQNNKTGLSYIHPSLFAALHLLLELALPCCLDHELGLSLFHRPHFLSRRDLFACEKRREGITMSSEQQEQTRKQISK